MQWLSENHNEKVYFACVDKTLLLVHPRNCPLVPVDYFPVICGCYVFVLVIGQSVDTILWYVIFTFYYLVFTLYFLVFALCLIKLHCSQPILRFKNSFSCLLLWWKTGYNQIIPKVLKQFQFIFFFQKKNTYAYRQSIYYKNVT